MKNNIILSKLIRRILIFLSFRNVLLEFKLFNKETETLKWMDNFKVDGEKSIFWDIGEYWSLLIYATCIHENLNVVSLSPVHQIQV